MLLYSLLMIALFLLPIVKWEPAPFDILMGVSFLLYGNQWKGIFVKREIQMFSFFLLMGVIADPQHLSITVPYFLKTAYIFFTGILLYSVFINKEDMLVKIISLGAFFWGVVVFVAYLSGWTLVQYDTWRLQGFFKDPNVFAAFYVFIFYISWVRQNIILLSLSLFLILAAMSRGAWLSLAIGSIILISYSWRKERTWCIRALFHSALATVFSLIYFLFSDRFSFFLGRNRLQPYDVERFANQKAGVEGILGSNPIVSDSFINKLLGYGHGTYEVYHQMSAHSLYVRMLFENGLVSLIVLCIVFIILLKMSWQKVEHWTGRLSLVSLTGFLINSFFIDTIHWRHFSVILALLLSIYYQNKKHKLDRKTVGDSGKVIGKEY